MRLGGKSRVCRGSDKIPWQVSICCECVAIFSPKGTAVNSPGRKPWDVDNRRTTKAPTGAIEASKPHSLSPRWGSLLPSGPYSQGLRPGLLTVAALRLDVNRKLRNS